MMVDSMINSFGGEVSMRKRMLIDEYLPVYDVRERHRITVHAPAEQVYGAVRAMDISEARLTRLLFRLRGLPCPPRFTLDDFLKMRFTLLGERPNEELLHGLVGKFWTPAGKLLRLEPEDYTDFNERGYAKAAWNFSLAQQANGVVSLATETRVHCTDGASRMKFRLYWTLIGAFSGLVRREMLQIIKRNAERGSRRERIPKP
ncbi:MAG: hypothetical protein LC778_15320 [Acidobacteria bacterium]|nr:hypothetical protein [Acidobacteriota bacterium]